MKLITLENDMPVFNPEIRVIKEFNAILRRDGSKEGDKNGRKKEFALKELSFIHFYCTFDNRFDLYESEEERNDAIKTAVALPEDWEIDSLIREGIRRYSDLMNTESMELVNRQRDAISKIKDFIADYDATELNKSGSLVFGPDKMQNLIKNMPDMIRSLNESKDIVEKELENKFGSGKRKHRSLAQEIEIDSESGQI